MTVRKLVQLVGVAVLLAGAIALVMPVSISDGTRGAIGCGNTVAPELADALDANAQSVANVPLADQMVPHTNYVAQCQSALRGRREWAMPLAAVGLVAALAAALTQREPVAAPGAL